MIGDLKQEIELGLSIFITLVVLGATFWLAWVFVSGGRPYFERREP